MGLYYYFGWGMKTGRDFEKFILWIMRKAHFDRFGHIEYNKETRYELTETADENCNHYTDYDEMDRLDNKRRETKNK